MMFVYKSIKKPSVLHSRRNLKQIFSLLEKIEFVEHVFYYYLRLKVFASSIRLSLPVHEYPPPKICILLQNGEVTKMFCVCQFEVKSRRN